MVGGTIPVTKVSMFLTGVTSMGGLMPMMEPRGEEHSSELERDLGACHHRHNRLVSKFVFILADFDKF